MNGKGIGWLIPVLVLGAIAYNSFFTVDERQLAIKFRFGEILRSDYEPGLYFKMPFIDRVSKFESRILTLEDRPEPFLTSEG